MNEGRKRQQAKWRVLDREQQDRAKDGNWRPMLGRQDLRGQDEGVDLGSDESKGDSGRDISDESKGDGGRINNGEEGKGEGNGTGTGEDSEGSVRVQFANGAGREFERMELPQTPGWVPKLTPTRRGDVLFLNVA
jgi:hypothetical protein